MFLQAVRAAAVAVRSTGGLGCRTLHSSSKSSARPSGKGWSALGVGAIGVAVAIGAAAVSCQPRRRKKPRSRGMPEGHLPRPDLPFFKIADLKKHTSEDDGIWVSYKGGVYDITKFLSGHPGGSGRLLMAAGNDLSIFWDVYRMHFKKDVRNFMERYRIGNLSPKDALTMETEFVFEDPYINDPQRSPDLLATTARPFCGECKLNLLGRSFFTPNHLHYTRLHLPVPNIPAEEWRVTVRGNGVQETVFSLQNLKDNFDTHELACTLQCAGNRREDFNTEDHTIMISPHWRVSAFSNAWYKGVYLRDVLEYCGLDVDAHHLAELPIDENIRNVEFESSDVSETGVQYGVSIPIEKAVDPRGDVMLVFEMNGEPLPRDHGGPVRMLCPGYVGNKSAKFIESITVQKYVSHKPWHWHAYRNFPPNYTFEEHLSNWDEVFGPRSHQYALNQTDHYQRGGDGKTSMPETSADLEKGPICYKMPVQSIITEPAGIAKIGGRGRKTVTVKGVAWTGNGVGMSRVDVSADGGKTWIGADFKPKPAKVAVRETDNRKWSWYQFEKEIPLTDEMIEALENGDDVDVELVSKGVDGAFNVQPERYGPYYNARGCVVNQMYRVPLVVKGAWIRSKVEAVAGEDAENPPTGGHYHKPWEHHGWDAKLAKNHEKLVPDAEGKRSVHWTDEEAGRKTHIPGYTE